MRFLKLIIKNIASIESAVIDFDSRPLADARLFLINGPTGSGKSVLLDAICLALFRTAPRLEGLGNRKCADDSVRSGELPLSSPLSLVRRGTADAEATLVFEGNNGRVYRASWVVTPYVKGANAGKINQESHLLVDCESQQVWDKKNDVRNQIESPELIGLDFDRFCRTVLLSQGNFTRFLSAAETEKAAILEKLVGISIFSKTGKEIRAIRSSLQRQLDIAVEGLNGIKPLTDDVRREKEELLAGLRDTLSSRQKRLETVNAIKDRFSAMEDAFRTIDREKRQMQTDSERLPKIAEARERLVVQRKMKSDELVPLIKEREEVADRFQKLRLDEMQREASLITADSDALNKCRVPLDRLSQMAMEIDNKRLAVEVAESDVAKLKKQLPSLEKQLTAASEHVEAFSHTIDIARRGIGDAAAALRHGLRSGDTCPVCGKAVTGEINDEVFALALRPLEEQMKKLKGDEKQLRDNVSVLNANIKLRQAEIKKQLVEIETLSGRLTAIRSDVGKRLAALAIEFDAGSIHAVDARIAENTRKLSELNGRIAAAGTVQRRLMELTRCCDNIVAETARIEKEISACSSDMASIESLTALRKKNVGDAIAAITVARMEVSPMIPDDCCFMEVADVTVSREQLQREISELNVAIGSATAVITADDNVKLRYARRLDEIKSMEREVALWSDVDRNFGGEKGERFSRIACAFILSQLLDRANYYLAMFDKRYQLDGRPDSLEIMVYDESAGHVRAFNTLSGGESFMVSLALALGLSAFQDISGTPDTIFIDEGFGTLSADCLDCVTETLERLQNMDGRRVGIISHVETLRDRIATRITVAPRGTRSEISVESNL